MGPEISWTAWNSSPEKKGVKASLQISVEALGAPYTKDFPGGSGGKASAYNAGDSGSPPSFLVKSSRLSKKSQDPWES